MTETIVHLVRHGEVHNPGKILYGRLPGYRLSERGEQMARLTGAALAERDIAKVVASPLLRAQQTAKPIAEPHG
ncbi:MAG: histidine phosphatase family protein, partial [Dermabacter sp.]|nr:histidine phosphatase family protein [Dermabacter sp.]